MTKTLSEKHADFIGEPMLMSKMMAEVKEKELEFMDRLCKKYFDRSFKQLTNEVAKLDFLKELKGDF